MCFPKSSYQINLAMIKQCSKSKNKKLLHVVIP
jgi:hypothetical protein